MGYDWLTYYKKRQGGNRIDKQKECSSVKCSLVEFLTETYGFDGFHHYTDITNLFNIIKTGYVYSRAYAGERMKVDAANEEVITNTLENIKDVTENVRFFYKEGTPTLFQNEGIRRDCGKPHMPIPVLLLFSKEIITHEGVSFLDGSGANLVTNDQVRTERTSNSDEALCFEWELIMCRGPHGKFKHLADGYGDKWQAQITNRRNAEFHYPNRIPIKYLDKIIFRSNAEMKYAKLLLDNKYHAQMIVNEKKFTFANKHNYTDHNWEYDINFLDDFTVKIVNDTFGIELFLKYSLQLYDHELILNDKNGDERIAIDLMKPNENQEITMDDQSIRIKIPVTDKEINEIKYTLNGIEYILWRKR